VALNPQQSTSYCKTHNDRVYSLHRSWHEYNTLCLKKQDLTFDYNFGKCRTIFKILSLTDSQRNCPCNCYRVFQGPPHRNCATLLV